MKRFLASLFVLATWWGCQSKSGVPGDILGPEKMEAVLFDMLRSGHFVNNFMLTKDSSLNKDQVQIEWLNKVLTFHGISEQQFKKSFSYYQEHPALMARVMDSISKKEEDPLIRIRKPGKPKLAE